MWHALHERHEAQLVYLEQTVARLRRHVDAVIATPQPAESDLELPVQLDCFLEGARTHRLAHLGEHRGLKVWGGGGGGPPPPPPPPPPRAPFLAFCSLCWFARFAVFTDPPKEWLCCYISQIYCNGNLEKNWS